MQGRVCQGEQTLLLPEFQAECLSLPQLSHLSSSAEQQKHGLCAPHLARALQSAVKGQGDVSFSIGTNSPMLFSVLLPRSKG